MEVPKFSKFIHGCVSLLPPEKIPSRPSWLQLAVVFGGEGRGGGGMGSAQGYGSGMVCGGGCFQECFRNCGWDEGGGTNNANTVIPMKVDPKSFFANERTFLQWVQAAMVIQIAGTAIINSSTGGFVAGALLSVGGGALLCYALANFMHRADKMSKKEEARYDDRRGPLVITPILLAAMVASFYSAVVNDL